MKEKSSCGLVVPVCSDLNSSIAAVRNANLDFVVTPIIHPRFAFDIPSQGEKPMQRSYPFTRSDYILPSNEWSSSLVAVLSKVSTGSLETSDQVIRRRCEESLLKELAFCAHVGVAAFLVELTKPINFNLARLMNNYIMRTQHAQIWVKIPIARPKSLLRDTENTTETWHWWNDFRSSVGSHKRLGVVLEVNEKAEAFDETIVRRWLGEPMKALILNTGLFLINKKGYPVLPKSVQALVKMFIPLNVQIIFEGRNRGHSLSHYKSYMDFLWDQQDTSDPVKQYAKGFEDYLQSPLQPLMDNLESFTYEVFEKDPVKYREYQRAIFLAIIDKIAKDEKGEFKQIIVMVLGAGRGPLVRATLEAARQIDCNVKVYAVEKNPNAIVTLLNQKEELWKDKVEVVSSDMRQWHPEEENKADIIVSELLGSFGDNELSPECLYSAQHLFKEDAVSIPSSYTSWVGPLMSNKLYNEVRASMDCEKKITAHFETPYVVHLQNRTELAPPVPLFTFVHPLKGEIDNNRYSIRNFKIEMDSELHGFGGYFECVLYKNIHISTNPTTHSPGMFSWFPIFFPLCHPVKLREGDNLQLHFWRVNDGQKVWYEWNVTKPVVLPIHNPAGRSYTIGL